MTTSFFSFILALVWCSNFIFIGTILRHRSNFVLKYGVNYILIIMTVGLIRLFLPIEPKFARIIEATSFLPVFQRALVNEAFQIWDYSISRFDVLISIWALGSTIYIIGIIIEILKLKRGMKKLTVEDNLQVQRILDSIVSDSKPKLEYHVIISKDIKSPMLVGYFKPTILMPSLSLTDDEMRYVLLHEWNHFLHKHLWTKLLLNVLCALLWWNPLVYLIKEDLDYILEVNCDRLVVNRLGDEDRLKYVEATTNVMKQLTGIKQKRTLSSIGFIEANPEKIVQRCELVLFPPKRFNKQIHYALGFLVLILVVLSYSFIVQPDTSPPIESDQQYLIISPENAYLSPNQDGTYKLFVDGQYLDTINSSDLNSLPYSELPMKIEEDS